MKKKVFKVIHTLLLSFCIYSMNHHLPNLLFSYTFFHISQLCSEITKNDVNSLLFESQLLAFPKSFIIKIYNYLISSFYSHFSMSLSHSIRLLIFRILVIILGLLNVFWKNILETFFITVYIAWWIWFYLWTNHSFLLLLLLSKRATWGMLKTFP